MTNKILVLDAGHGYNTPGKRCLNGSNGAVREWTMNHNVCMKVKNILADYEGITIKFTHDETGKTDIDLLERVKRCNNFKADLFISIHHNANTSKWGDWTGTEVYWHSKGTSEDKKVAGLLAPKLASYTGLKNRGVKQASFTVLTCKSTAILVEGGFMDSRIDYPVITSSKGQDAYAKAVAELVINYFNLKKKPQATTSSSQVMYRVIAGSYSVKDNANKIKAQLVSLGYTGTFLVAVQKDGKTYYQVVCGSYSNKATAETMRSKLIGQGYTSAFLQAI